MTGQVADILVLRNRPRELHRTPLDAWTDAQPEGFSFAEHLGLPPDHRISSCWRGYIGRWIIGEDGGLRLAGLAPPIGSGRWRKPPPSLFPGCRQGVFAHWFSGVLRVVWGRMRTYRHHGFARDYEHECYLLFRRGRLVREILLGNPPTAVFDAAVARSIAMNTPYEPVGWREREAEVMRMLGLSPAEPDDEDWVEDDFDDDPHNAPWADTPLERDEHGRLVVDAAHDALYGHRHDAERRWEALRHPDVRITPVTVAQAEALGRIDAPPDAGIPDLPFGLLNPGWRRFVARMQPGDTLAAVDVDAGRTNSRNSFWLRWMDYRSIHLFRDGRSLRDFVYEGG